MIRNQDMPEVTLDHKKEYLILIPTVQLDKRKEQFRKLLLTSTIDNDKYINLPYQKYLDLN